MKVWTVQNTDNPPIAVFSTEEAADSFIAKLWLSDNFWAQEFEVDVYPSDAEVIYKDD